MKNKKLIMMMTKNIKSLLLAGVVSCGFAAAITSCHSGNQEFDDFVTQRCYFAKQFPVRTVELGNDLNVDLTLDNQHKIQIQAAMGGAYSNRRDINIDIEVAPDLVHKYTLKDELGTEITDVTEMPSRFYNLLDNKIVIPAGQATGGVLVQLTDDFFADKDAVNTHYVIPIRMKNATGVDSILSDKNYVLYFVKYVNRYHGNYVVDNDLGTVVSITTKSLNTALFNYQAKDAEGNNHLCLLELAFDDNDKCTISTTTAGFDVTGSGEFKEEAGELGARLVDTMHLTFNVKNSTLGIDVTENLDLKVRDRGVKPEYLSIM